MVARMITTAPAANRELIEKHIGRITVKPQTLEIWLAREIKIWLAREIKIWLVREIKHDEGNRDQEILGQASLKNNADIVMTEYEVQALATREKTARLKAFRLAKEVQLQKCKTKK
jgi:hypothetical protein